MNWTQRAWLIYASVACAAMVYCIVQARLSEWERDSADFLFWTAGGTVCGVMAMLGCFRYIQAGPPR